MLSTVTPSSADQHCVNNLPAQLPPQDEVAADTGALVVEEPASVAYDAVGTKNTLRHAIAAGDEERVRHLVEVRRGV